MSIQKPTAEEFKQWEDQLKDDGLSMDRGYNGHKLNYGFDDSDSLVRGWDDIKIYTRQKRKTRKSGAWLVVPHCGTCGKSFTAKRKDARFCSWSCRVKTAQQTTDKSSH